MRDLLSELDHLRNRCINLENELESTRAALDEAKYSLAPDWSRVPEWANFYTMNKNGCWIAHEVQPYQWNLGWRSSGLSKKIGWQEIVVDWEDAHFQRAFVPNEGEHK